MKTAIVFFVTFAAGAMFFACAKGDDGVAGDGGDGVGVSDDASNGDGSGDGNTSYLKDSAAPDGAIGDGGADADGAIPPVCVESDAGCSTGSPGACADGVLHCSDAGLAVCEPIATTESCYSSPVTTENKGICHDGTQTCTGTLGACIGEQGPMTVENCFNNTDDDCDGFINNGCPTSLSLGSSRTLAGNGGTGGGLHTLVCPAGAFVTRVDSWFDDSDKKASGVSIYCATPTLVQGAIGYSVTLAANTPAPYGTEHGGTSPSNERTDDCGISGLTAITYSLGSSDSFVEALGHHCSSSAVTLASDNTISFSFSHLGYSNGEYNSYGTPPGTFFDADCNTGESPANQVVIGFSIHDGNFLDNITPICAPLLVNYSAGTPDP